VSAVAYAYANRLKSASMVRIVGRLRVGFVVGLVWWSASNVQLSRTRRRLGGFADRQGWGGRGGRGGVGIGQWGKGWGVALEVSVQLHLLIFTIILSTWTEKYMYIKYHFFICAMLNYTKPFPVPRSFKEQVAAFYAFPHHTQGGSGAARDTFAQ